MAGCRWVVESFKVGRGAENGGKADSTVGAVVFGGREDGKVFCGKSPDSVV